MNGTHDLFCNNGYDGYHFGISDLAWSSGGVDNVRNHNAN